MIITKKYAALLLAVLLLTGTLTGCSASGSNAGVWIAVIVMVFIAVFSATSGIVYLVLQRVLPPEKPKVRTRREYTSDAFEAPRPAAAPRRTPGAGGAAPRANPAAGGVWICPRDKTRNTGPYCSVCGGNRPAAPRPAARPTAETPAAQRPVRAQGTPGVNQQPVRNRPAQTTGFAIQEPKPQQPEAPVYTAPAPAPQPEKVQQYQGAFARPTQTEPSALDMDLDFDVDSELLEAIFREAAQGSEEE